MSIGIVAASQWIFQTPDIFTVILVFLIIVVLKWFMERLSMKPVQSVPVLASQGLFSSFRYEHCSVICRASQVNAPYASRLFKSYRFGVLDEPNNELKSNTDANESIVQIKAPLTLRFLCDTSGQLSCGNIDTCLPISHSTPSMLPFDEMTEIDPADDNVHTAHDLLTRGWLAAAMSSAHQNIPPAANDDDAPPFLQIGARLPCLGLYIPSSQTSNYLWDSFDDTRKRMALFGTGLLDWLHDTRRGRKEDAPRLTVGLMADSCPEWIVTEQSCFAYNWCEIILPVNISVRELQRIIRDEKIQVLVLSLRLLNKLWSALRGTATPSSSPSISISALRLTHIIVLDEPLEEDLKRAHDLRMILSSFHSLELRGLDSATVVPFSPVSGAEKAKEVVASIVYTMEDNGTLSNIIMTHRQLVSAVGAFTASLPFSYQFSTLDVYANCVPLCHPPSRMMALSMLSCGVRIGFCYDDDVSLLLRDLQVLQPTILFLSTSWPLMPIYHALRDIHDFKRFWLARLIIRQREQDLLTGRLSKGNSIQHWSLSHIRNAVGGKVRMIICGPAPIAPHIPTWLRVTLGCEVLHGFTGRTVTGWLTLSQVGDYAFATPNGKYGLMGATLGSHSLQLRDVSNMRFLATDVPHPRGQLYVKGAIVGRGSSACWTADGWLATGAIVELLPNGTFRYIDHLSRFFKLQTGELIAPSKIEAIYSQSRFVSQIFVYAEVRGRFLVAIVVPNMDILLKHCTTFLSGRSGLNNTDWDQRDLQTMCDQTHVCDHVLRDLQYIGHLHDLKSCEQVRSVVLESTPWTRSNDLMTCAGVLRRDLLRQKYSNLFMTVQSESVRKKS